MHSAVHCSNSSRLEEGSKQLERECCMPRSPLHSVGCSMANFVKYHPEIHFFHSNNSGHLACNGLAYQNNIKMRPSQFFSVA